MRFYRLKIMRKSAPTATWRRVFVPGGITFSALAVVLEEMLEIEHNGQFEFEFYQAKERISEEKFSSRAGFWYSQLFANDTYIDSRMESEKWFTFRRIDSDTVPEYRANIEQAADENSFIETYMYPRISAERCPEDDEFWKKTRDEINDRMETYFWCNETDENTYKKSNEIAEDIFKKHSELSVCTIPKDISSGNAKAMAEAIRQIGEILGIQVGYDKADTREKEDTPKHTEASENETSLKSIDDADLEKISSRRLWEFLETNSQQDLKDAMNYHYHMPVTDGLDSRQLANIIASHLLTEEAMKNELYRIPEESLDIFDRVVEDDDWDITEEDPTTCEFIFGTGYAFRYQNQSNGDAYMVIPDEVKKIYRSIRADGYRRSHWLLTCENFFCNTVMLGPVSLLCDIFEKKDGMQITEKGLLELHAELTEKWQQCTIKNGTVTANDAMDEYAIRYIKIMRKACPADYYHPELHSIYWYSATMNPEDMEPYCNLLNFLIDELKLDHKKSDDLMKSLLLTALSGKPVEAILRMEDTDDLVFDNEKQAEKFIRLYDDLYEVVREPVLKGHTPAEMEAAGLMQKKEFKMPDSIVFHMSEGYLAGHKPAAGTRDNRPKPVVKQKKVYPNDPCPCGSGKKYKNCCGKKKKV